MKKIIIGTLLGGILYFAYESVMWMGGFHQGFTNYTSNQNAVVKYLSENLTEDGAYMMPIADPNSPNAMEEQHKMMESSIGKPWAMIFYHKSMSPMNPIYILIGFLYALIASLITSLILYYGNFKSFSARFVVSMAFSCYALCQGVLDDMNWWSFPWSFIREQVIDLTLGWGITSVWLAWYVKK